MTAAPRFALIAALDEAGGIGLAGEMPWRLPPDMAYFRAVTAGPGAMTNAVLMGRKTWESIAPRYRPLPGRLNIVLSHTPARLDLPEGALAAGSLDEALALGASRAHRFIIGGGALYTEAITRPECARLILTRLEGDFNCDTHFPTLPTGFTLAHRGPPLTHRGQLYRFERWIRRPERR